MLVQFRCPACNESVTNKMDICPKCAAPLPVYDFENIYSKDLGETEPEQTNSPLTHIEDFSSGLVTTLIGPDEEVGAHREAQGARIKNEKGWVAYQGWVLWQSLPTLLIACLYLFLWLPLLLALIPEQVEEIFWLKFFVGALMPLYGVSLYLLIQGDPRSLPLIDKLLEWAVPAFNRLLMFLFLLGSLFMLGHLLTTVDTPFLFNS